MGRPPRHVKNLDPPMRTSFPHAELRRQRGQSPGAQREGSGTLGGCSAGELAPELNKSSRRHAHPEEGRRPQESRGWGGPAPARLPPPREPVVKAETMERAPETRGGETAPPEREGQARGGGERRGREEGLRSGESCGPGEPLCSSICSVSLAPLCPQEPPTIPQYASIMSFLAIPATHVLALRRLHSLEDSPLKLSPTGERSRCPPGGSQT